MSRCMVSSLAIVGEINGLRLWGMLSEICGRQHMHMCYTALAHA